MLLQPGLKWVLNRCFEAEPTWTHDPKIKTIIKLARRHLRLNDDDVCTADYYMQGAFNKIYLIRCPRGGANEQSFAFRVSLPVDPGFKVSSDVATMNFVRDHTDAPIPRVLAFNPSHQNELGFAWTIMEMMPGKPLCEQWRFMTWKQKEDLVKKVAEILAQMFRHKFFGIGNLYQIADASPHKKIHHPIKRSLDSATNASTAALPAVTQSTQSQPIDGVRKNWLLPTYEVGRIVSMSFLWHNRVHFDVYRGPFSCSHDWLAARLDLVIRDSDATLSEPAKDQQHKVFANKYSSIAKRLRKQLRNFFPPNGSCEGGVTSEITALHHYDTSGYNVLVDEEGSLTALLDWDGVSTVPLWKACEMPEFLMSRFIDEIGDDKRACIDGDCIGSQISKDEAISLEKMQLRTAFLVEMERIEPDWAQIHRTSAILADFEAAVHLCDSLFRSDVVDEWLHDIEQGKEYWSLCERPLSGK